MDAELIVEHVNRLTEHIHEYDRDEIRNQAVLTCLESKVRSVRPIERIVKQAIRSYRNQFFGTLFRQVSLSKRVGLRAERLESLLPDARTLTEPLIEYDSKPVPARKSFASSQPTTKERIKQLREDIRARNQHGIFSSYVGGCRCDLCRAAAARAAREGRERHKNGDRRYLVDATPVRDHVRKLMQQTGCSMRSIAVCAKTTHTMLRNIANNPDKRIRSHILHRILNVDKEAVRAIQKTHKRRRRNRVPARRYRTMLKNIMHALGFTINRISFIVYGRSNDTLYRLINGDSACISISTASIVDKLYKALKERK